MEFLVVVAIILFVIIVFVARNAPWILILLGIAVTALIVIAVAKSRRRKKEVRRFNEEYVEDYSFITKVVGVTFNGVQNVLPTLRSGMPITLVREPNNPHDSNAVAVRCNGRNIGHLDFRTAIDIARVMDNGIPVKGTVIAITGGGRYTYGCNIKVIVYKSTKEPSNAANPSKPKISELKSQIENIDKSNPFYCKVCVIYGFYNKAEVAQELVNLGAIIKGNVTDKTDIVVTTYPDWLNSGTVNANKAKELIAEGKQIRIMKRDEYISIKEKYLK